MSPRKPAVLRGDGAQDLRGYLIATAARLIGERGSAGLGVREIARQAQVADGVLYNYFEDKDDLLAQALLVHVGTVMHASAPRMPAAGTGSVADNLRLFIDSGLDILARVAPAFAGLATQPGVLTRFHAMVGGDPAFVGDSASQDSASQGEAGGESHRAEPGDGGPREPGEGARGLPDILSTYLRAEQRLGRVAADTDVDAAVSLVVGAIHGEVLPRVMFAPPGVAVTTPEGLSGRIAQTVMRGIGPR